MRDKERMEIPVEEFAPDKAAVCKCYMRSRRVPPADHPLYNRHALIAHRVEKVRK
jgi:hypothetical protein